MCITIIRISCVIKQKEIIDRGLCTDLSFTHSFFRPLSAYPISIVIHNNRIMRCEWQIEKEDATRATQIKKKWEKKLLRRKKNLCVHLCITTTMFADENQIECNAEELLLLLRLHIAFTFFEIHDWVCSVAVVCRRRWWTKTEEKEKVRVWSLMKWWILIYEIESVCVRVCVQRENKRFH